MVARLFSIFAILLPLALFFRTNQHRDTVALEGKAESRAGVSAY